MARSRWRSIASFALEFALALAGWLVFTAKLQPHELIAGVVASVIAASAASVARAQHLIRFVARVRDFAQLVRLPKLILGDTWITLRVLARALSGRKVRASCLREAAFDSGSDPQTAAMRRALATAFSSVTPNLIVLGFDRKRQRMIFHQLQPAPLGTMPERLGAQP